MRILLDTNIVLDVLLKRNPWVNTASIIWQAIDDKQIDGYIVACTLTDIFYIARRLTTQTAVQICLNAFHICPVEQETLEKALTLPGNDFEDNVQIASAIQSNLEAIITRDPSGFSATNVPIMAPDEFVTQHLRTS
jgi:predicted nucleic acid-binding protein